MKNKSNVYILTLCGLILAIMLIFGFTPLGNIKMLGFSITLMGIPVAIIAIAFGPYFGAIAGFIWGSISLIQAFAGLDSIGALLLSSDIEPLIKFGGLIAICYVRVIVGFLTGLIYDAIRLIDKKGIISSYVSCLALSILNTVLFMSLFTLFFYKSGVIQDLCLTYNLDANNAFLFICGFVGINFFVEVLSTSLIGGTSSMLIIHSLEKMNYKSPLPHLFIKKNEH